MKRQRQQQRELQQREKTPINSSLHIKTCVGAYFMGVDSTDNGIIRTIYCRGCQLGTKLLREIHIE
jgi:hypothetical protein